MCALNWILNGWMLIEIELIFTSKGFKHHWSLLITNIFECSFPDIFKQPEDKFSYLFFLWENEWHWKCRDYKMCIEISFDHQGRSGKRNILTFKWFNTYWSEYNQLVAIKRLIAFKEDNEISFLLLFTFSS